MVLTPSSKSSRPTGGVDRGRRSALHKLTGGRLHVDLTTSGPLIFLVVLIVGFGAARGRFLHGSNLSTIALTASILGVATLAQTLVVLTRNLDLSIGSVVSAGGYLPLLLFAHAHYPGWLVVPLALCVGAAWGLLNGIAVGYLRLPSLIATLATMSIIAGVLDIADGGREIDTYQLPTWLPSAVTDHVLGVPVNVLVAIVVFLAVAFMLRRTAFGRTIYAVGSSAEAARFYGLPSRRTICQVYVLGGVLAGLAGLMLVGYVGTATVDNGSGWELQTLAASVLGGASLLGGSGRASGAAIGALIIATINNGLVQLGLSGNWATLVQGAAIVVAIGFDVAVRRRASARRRGAAAVVAEAPR